MFCKKLGLRSLIRAGEEWCQLPVGSAIDKITSTANQPVAVGFVPLQICIGRL